MSYLAITRHGLSTSNVQGKVAGHTDVPLEDLGKQQARDVGKVLRSYNFQHAFGSPLIRAKETLEIILSKADTPIEPSFHIELMERNWGICEGMDAGSRGNGKYTASEVDSWFEWDGRPPGGESYADMSNRVVGFYENTVLPLLKNGENVLIVFHNGISKPLQRHIEGLPHSTTNELNLDNCGVKLYEFDEEVRLTNIKKLSPFGKVSV